MKNKVWIFILIFLLVAGGGIGAFFLLRKKDEDIDSAPETTAPETTAPETTAPETTAPASAVITAANASSNRVALIKEMNDYINQLYKSDSELNKLDPNWNKNIGSIKSAAGSWAKSMFDWCRDNTNGWSFEDQQASANANGYPLSLQMVQSVAYQLYASKKLYNNLVWEVLSDRIFNLV